MAGIGGAVVELAMTGQRRRHLVGDEHAGDRQIARRQALGDGHEIGLDAEVLAAEPGAEAAETADDLVGNQQNLVPATDGGDLRPVAFRRDDDTAGALDRFGDEGGFLSLLPAWL